MSELGTFARDAFAAIDAHDLQAVQSRLASNCEFAAPGFAGTGAGTVIAFMAPFLAAFPDIHHDVVNTLEAGDTVAIELEITGTHTEALAGPEGELPPTGRRMNIKAANVWEVRDGQITSYRVYFDTGTLMAQLTGAAG
jgi:steroid delta-isomerase-like uncharacterized protein